MAQLLLHGLFHVVIADVQAIAQDKNATVTISENGSTFIIQVDAQDGKHSRTYFIEQVILLSSNARLEAIYIDNALLRDFDPDILEYTYYLTSGAQPNILTVPEDSDATIVESMFLLNEPLYIYVTAPDGTERTYTIHFLSSTIETAKTPQANDVLVKRLAGSNDLVFATLRKNVSIAILLFVSSTFL